MHARAITLWFALLPLLVACGSRVDHPGAGIIGVGYVGLTVADLEATSAFYQQGAALEAIDAPGPLDPVAGLAGSEVVATRMLRSANAQLRLMQFDTLAAGEPVPVNGPGIAHVCYQVNSTTDTYPRFLAAGATAIGATDMVQLSAKNPVEYAYALDLEGSVIEVEHVDVAALDLAKPPAHDYRIRQVALSVADMDATLAFYSTLLGGQEPRRVGRFLKLSGDKLDRISGLPESKLQMGWLQTRNLELEFVEYVSHPVEVPAEPRPVNAPGYSMIVFDVADLAVAEEALLVAGGTVVAAPTSMDGGDILFGRDPEGNLLGFQKVNAQAAVSAAHFPNNGIEE